MSSNNKTYSVLGYPLLTETMNVWINLALERIQSKNPIQIVTVGVETVINANKNAEFANLLKSNQFNSVDGAGIQWAINKIHNKKVPKIAGVELSYNIMQALNSLGKGKVYILGAQESTLAVALEKLRLKFPSLEIVGRNGFFTKQDEQRIITTISEFAPDLLLVGIGAPKQDLFISDYLTKLNASVSIGVGGSIDVFSGTVKRAPVLVQKVKLEWLYRLIQAPSKYKRYYSLFEFVHLIYKK